MSLAQLDSDRGNLKIEAKIMAWHSAGDTTWLDNGSSGLGGGESKDKRSDESPVKKGAKVALSNRCLLRIASRFLFITTTSTNVTSVSGHTLLESMYALPRLGRCALFRQR